MDYSADILEGVKALLYMVSVLAALYFVGLFKGRWFFALLFCFALPSAHANYTLWQWYIGSQVYVSYALKPGDTEASILSSVFSMQANPPGTPQWRVGCSLNPIAPTHLAADWAIYKGPGGSGVVRAMSSQGLVFCPICSGHGSFSRRVIDIGADGPPPSVYESANAGPKTGPYGEIVETTIIYAADGYTPIGYTLTTTPPPGATGIYNGDGVLTGYVEGQFKTNADGSTEWEYNEGYETVPDTTLKTYYETMSDWYDKWNLQESEFKLTRDQFAVYISSSLARGSSIENAILALSPASSSDIAAAKTDIVNALESLSSAEPSIVPADLQAASSAIVAAIQSSSGGSTGEPAAPVDLTQLENDLHSIVTPSGSSISRDFESEIVLSTPAEPQETIDIKDYYTSWNTGLPGLLGSGLDFSFDFLFGSVPSIGSQASITISSFSLPHVGQCGGVFSLPDNVDPSIIRSCFLFALLVGFAFSASKIISSGMDI